MRLYELIQTRSGNSGLSHSAFVSPPPTMPGIPESDERTFGRIIEACVGRGRNPNRSEFVDHLNSARAAGRLPIGTRNAILTSGFQARGFMAAGLEERGFFRLAPPGDNGETELFFGDSGIEDSIEHRIVNIWQGHTVSLDRIEASIRLTRRRRLLIQPQGSYLAVVFREADMNRPWEEWAEEIKNEFLIRWWQDDRGTRSVTYGEDRFIFERFYGQKPDTDGYVSLSGGVPYAVFRRTFILIEYISAALA